jgi:nicotinate-nucleotide pyrophosphorylase (carboxylating)
MVLIKDNHIRIAGSVAEAFRRTVGEEVGPLPAEIEVRDLSEVEEAIGVGAKRLLLDNMDIANIREAVKFVNGRAELEASGGITLETVRGIAEAGVDFISVGALTHSAPALDVSMKMELS